MSRYASTEIEISRSVHSELDVFMISGRSIFAQDRDQADSRNMSTDFHPDANAFGGVATAGSGSLNETALSGLNVVPKFVDRCNVGHPNWVFERKFPVGASLEGHCGHNLDSNDYAIMCLERPENSTELFGVVGVTRTWAGLLSAS